MKDESLEEVSIVCISLGSPKFPHEEAVYLGSVEQSHAHFLTMSLGGNNFKLLLDTAIQKQIYYVFDITERNV